MNPLLRLMYAAINAGRWLAPPSRRREWRRQWRADVAHEWQRMERQDRGVAARASLLARVAGALRHAFWLRMHVRRLEMITQDLRYGWRLMVQKPAFTLVAVMTLGLGIGANVSMYSWLDGRLRHLLDGVEHADRIVALNTTLNGRDGRQHFLANFRRPARAPPGQRRGSDRLHAHPAEHAPGQR